MRRKIIPYNPQLKQLARDLRNNSTRAEIVLWGHLKGKQVEGFDFHRQKPIDNFICDFFCNELMLAIEVDGITHDDEEVKKKDKIKEKLLNELGVTVLRFTDHEVLKLTNSVVEAIRKWIKEHTPGPSQEGSL